jgi:hypothetical protein
MTNLPVPTPPPSRGAIIASKVRQAVRQAAVAAPVAVGAGATVAALALPHGWFHAAVEAVQAIGLGNVLVLAAGAVTLRWGERAAGFLVPEIRKANERLGAIANMATHSALTLKEAIAESSEERGEQADRLEEMSHNSDLEHANLAEGLRRCEENSRRAAEAAEAARAEVVNLSSRFGAALDRAVAIADRAATEAARAAMVCEALAREFQREGVVPAAFQPTSVTFPPRPAG